MSWRGLGNIAHLVSCFLHNVCFQRRAALPLIVPDLVQPLISPSQCLFPALSSCLLWDLNSVLFRHSVQITAIMVLVSQHLIAASCITMIECMRLTDATAEADNRPSLSYSAQLTPCAT